MSERELEDLIAVLEKTLGLSWSDVVEWLRGQNPVDAIEKRLIERGLAGSLVTKVTDAAARFADSLHDSYVKSGQQATKWLDDRLPDSLIRFDQTNNRAVARAQAQRYELIEGFTQEQREVTRRVVSEGLRDGVNPRVQAKAIRESIGLTDKQSQFVAKYRSELESGDWSAALSRELRDGRSDKLLRRLRSEGGALSQEQIDSLVDRYRKNWVSYRAETIARTESLRAAHQGHDEAMQQAVERGDLELGQLENEWHAGRRTKNSRDQHLAMDGKRVPFGTKFRLPDGMLMTGPGDPAGGAKHTANCRCTRSTSLRDPAAPAPAVEVQTVESQLPMPRKALAPVGRETFLTYKTQFTADLDERERAGFLMYSSNKYEYINEVLRKGKPHGEWSETIAAMDQGFAKFRAPEDMKVLRGAGSGKRFKDLKPGDVYVDKAYLSTSIDRKVASASLANMGGTEGAMWEIEIPKGAYLAPIPSLYEKELEFVLPRASKLRVLEIEKVGGVTYYRAILEP